MIKSTLKKLFLASSSVLTLAIVLMQIIADTAPPI